MGVEQIGGSQFQDSVLSSKEPVLVDFFATWCGPCRMLDPIVKELSEAYAGQVKFVKVDIDEAQGVAEQFSVTHVPTLLLVKDGEEAGRKTGVVPKPALEGWIKQHM